MAKYKLTRETWAALDRAGLHISSIWQQPQNDGRKLKNVAEPSDPWTVLLCLPEVYVKGKPLTWFTALQVWGEGATADEAVVDAMSKTDGLEVRYKKLGVELDRLGQAMREAA
jgi:hypothetical protein